MKYTIFGDNLIEADWFQQLSPRLRAAEYQKIGSRGTNPAIIDDLVRYDRPDIILLADNRPVLVVEKTREVPTGHNVGQRVARIVRAVEVGIPTIKFFPFDARKHGDYSSVCNLNIRLIAAFKRMQQIHDVPVLAVNWPVDESHELIDDGSENDRMRTIVDEFLESHYNPSCGAIRAQIGVMESEYVARLARFRNYGNPPGGSVYFKPTQEVLSASQGNVNGDHSRAFGKRAQSLIYEMKMTPTKCRRQDPYTGTQFIYDYLWCRSGAAPSAKHTNLVLRFPLLTRQRWYQANPNDLSTKSSNWYLVASALWFSDGLDVLQ